MNVGAQCSSCRKPDAAIYRCRQCFNMPALCSECIVTCHQRQPFHHIEKWNETHFDTYSLDDLNLVMYLGHGGQSCSASLKPKAMVIIHTNGIHRRSVQFCDCNNLIPNVEQLMLARLFPATLSSPATAFTFELLETFHQLTHSSKITAYDYFDTLKKMTDAAFPQDVQVCKLQ